MILQSLAGLPAFLVYFCTGVVAVMAYLFVYARVTPSGVTRGGFGSFARAFSAHFSVGA